MRLTEAQRAFLDRPLHAVVATLRRDGTAVQSVVWYARDGDELWLSVAPDSVKVAHLRRDPRVAVLVLGADGGAYLALEGTATVAGEVDYVPMASVRGRIAGTLALIYPPGIGIVVPGERYDARAQPMIDYFLAFEESCNRFPGFSYEVQGVYQEPDGDGVRFYTYVVRERERARTRQAHSTMDSTLSRST